MRCNILHSIPIAKFYFLFCFLVDPLYIARHYSLYFITMNFFQQLEMLRIKRGAKLGEWLKLLGINHGNYNMLRKTGGRNIGKMQELASRIGYELQFSLVPITITPVVVPADPIPVPTTTEPELPTLPEPEPATVTTPFGIHEPVVY